MSALASPSVSAPKIRLWRWTVTRYDRALDLGLFTGRRVELVEGSIVRMAAQHEPHVHCVKKADSMLASAFGAGYTTRRQAPIHLGRWSKPEPDIVVVPGTDEDYLRNGPPTSALVLVEVSDATLAYDRGRKAAMYAKNSILDYWILNLIDRQLELHRRPIKDPSVRNRFRYADIAILKPDEELVPLARPDLKIRVGDLLPVLPSGSRR